jgi:hydrogenase expression/formation protein HypC
MCLAVPVKIEALLDQQQALVNLGGVSTTISVALVENLQPGDYVILHVGYALNKLDQEEAEATLKLFADHPITAEGDS